MKKIKGFTLAEVLITLTILGVVAAITIPSLIQRQTERSTVAKVKKFYASLDQAYEVAKVEHGPVQTWGNGHMFEPNYSHNEDLYELLIKPNFRIAKVCGINNNNNCMFSGEMKYLNGNDTGMGNYSTNAFYYKILLSDNASLWFRIAISDADKAAIFWYDVNGPKEPNQLGKDIFIFFVDFTGVYSYILSLHDPNNSTIRGAFDTSDCEKSTQYGWTCAAYILKHGNMNYLHKK